MVCWSWIMVGLALGLAGVSPLWHMLDDAWLAKHEAVVWMHRLRLAKGMALLSEKPVTIASRDPLEPFSWSKPLCAHVEGFTQSTCWPAMPHCIASTWPDQLLQWDTNGLPHGQQGRWLFGSKRSCCWQVVMSHAGRLRLTFQHDTLTEIIH